MKEKCPDADHLPMEWLSASFSMISLDQVQSATATPAQGSLAAIRHVVRDKVSQPMADMQQRLDEHTQRHTANELNSRQVHLNQREKDRRFRVAAFSNKAAQYHAGDLFNIESCAMENYWFIISLNHSKRLLSPATELNASLS